MSFHLLEASQLAGAEGCERLFHFAESMKEVQENHFRRLLKGRVVSLYFEDRSFNSLLSLQSIIRRMGGDYIGGFRDGWTLDQDVNNPGQPPATEQLGHLAGLYSDLAIVQNSIHNWPKRFARNCGVPTLSAGNGLNEDPLFALGDLYALWSCRRPLYPEPMAGLRILVVGWPGKYGRSMSFLRMLTNWPGTNVILVQGQEYRLSDNQVEDLTKAGLTVQHENVTLEEACRMDADLVYLTGHATIGEAAESDLHNWHEPTLQSKHLETLPGHCRIFHPLPIGVEAAWPSAHKDDRCAWYQQASMTYWLHGSLLALLLGDLEDAGLAPPGQIMKPA